VDFITSNLLSANDQIGGNVLVANERNSRLYFAAC